MGVWSARVEDRLAWVIVFLRPARVPASHRWATPRGGRWVPSRDERVPISAISPERRGSIKGTKESRDSRRIQRQIWRVRGRPGRPLRRGRSSSCARLRTATRTATRTAALRCGLPAMVSYPSCSRWCRTHQWNSSAAWILLVGVDLNPRYWGTFRRRHERRCPQPSSGSTGAHCRLARMVGARCQTRTVRCMVRMIHGFSNCHRVAQASMSGRI